MEISVQPWDLFFIPPYFSNSCSSPIRAFEEIGRYLDTDLVFKEFLI
jgi:hypothetical protein